jgi:hypothetical protein
LISPKAAGRVTILERRQFPEENVSKKNAETKKQTSAEREHKDRKGERKSRQKLTEYAYSLKHNLR